MRLARWIGFFETTRMLRTSPFAATAIPGSATTFSVRWYSIEGMIATSAAPLRNASAHCDGHVNDKSYLPASGPSVNPHTSGAVFKYSTIEMRSLLILQLATYERLMKRLPNWRRLLRRACPNFRRKNRTRVWKHLREETLAAPAKFAPNLQGVRVLGAPR